MVADGAGEDAAAPRAPDARFELEEGGAQLRHLVLGGGGPKDRVSRVRSANESNNFRPRGPRMGLEMGPT
jgi:hypothetical protein